MPRIPKPIVCFIWCCGIVLGMFAGNNANAAAQAEHRAEPIATESRPKREAQSAKAPEGFDAQHVYKKIGDAELTLYVYKPKGLKEGDGRPAIVFFHGGGWIKGDPSQFEKHCQHFAKRGMVAITVQYRLRTIEGVKIDDCVTDAIDAMRWVRGHAKQLGIDPQRIASGGGSAGGHLAACVTLVDLPKEDRAVERPSPRPNAMVLFNPAMVLAPDKRLTEAENKRIQGIARFIRREPKKISPLAYAKNPDQPPCLMLFGTKDRLLKPAQLFLEDSTGVGNTCRVVTYKDQKHSFFNYRDGKNPYYKKTLMEADRFLTGLGWLERADKDAP